MNMIVTNLRIPEDRYQLLKTLAAEQRVSFNEYANRVLERAVAEKIVGRKRRKKTKNIFRALLEIADMPNRPMGLSEDDKIIYG